MNKNKFYKQLIDSCDLTAEDLNDQTLLEDIGFDSLAVMTMIAFIDSKFNVVLTGKDFQELTTLYSLVEKIGIEKFQDD
jgi:acyl carrier protein